MRDRRVPGQEGHRRSRWTLCRNCARPHGSPPNENRPGMAWTWEPSPMPRRYPQNWPSNPPNRWCQRTPRALPPPQIQRPMPPPARPPGLRMMLCQLQIRSPAPPGDGTPSPAPAPRTNGGGDLWAERNPLLTSLLLTTEMRGAPKAPHVRAEVCDGRFGPVSKLPVARYQFVTRQLVSLSWWFAVTSAGLKFRQLRIISAKSAVYARETGYGCRLIPVSVFMLCTRRASRKARVHRPFHCRNLPDGSRSASFSPVAPRAGRRPPGRPSSG